MNVRRIIDVALVLAVLAVAGWFVMKRSSSSGRLASDGADSTVLGDSAYRTCNGASNNDQQACYERMLIPIVTSHGARVAMGALNRVAAQSEKIKTDGHVYAHGIGIAAGKSGGDVGQVFASCNESFQSGCYHGVIQAYFETVSVVDTTAVNGLCQTYSGPNGDRWLRFQCVHGMGHGLTMYYGHHLPKALAGCDLLRDGWDRESCFGGAFMENIVNATVPHHPANALVARNANAPGDTAAAAPAHEHDHHAAAPAGATRDTFTAIDPRDPLYPCSIMAERFLNACYGMQTAAILFHNKGDIRAAAQVCARARPESMRYVCHSSLGRDVFAYSRQQPAEAIRMCGMAAEEYQPWCHHGVVKNFVDPRPENGFDYCRAVPGTSNKMKCYAAVGEQIASLRNTTPEREAMCAPVEPAFRSSCLFGAAVNPVMPAGMPVPRTRS